MKRLVAADCAPKAAGYARRVIRPRPVDLEVVTRFLHSPVRPQAQRVGPKIPFRLQHPRGTGPRRESAVGVTESAARVDRRTR